MIKDKDKEKDKQRKLLSLNRDARGPAVEERLQKVLANAGLGSRRSLDERIAAGEIRINGTTAAVGQVVKAGDRVELDGKAFVAVQTQADEAEMLIYHKPAGEVTTHDDPEGRPTLFESLPHLKGSRWVSVGRLDINTTGLLLVTTDGELAHTLMHPSAELAREYICRVHGTVSEEMLERLRKGVELDDGPACFDELHVINMGDSHSWFRVIVREGRNREVRRLWESQGLEVSRLKRTRYGNVELPRELRRGHHQALTPEQVKELRMSLGLPSASDTLTLEPVIGVRRAVKQSEFRPTGDQPAGWMHGAGDEARELRAFDRVRDDDRAARPGAKRRRPRNKGGPGAGAGGPRREGGKPQRSGPPGQRSGPPGQRTGAPGQRSGPPGQRTGAPGAPGNAAQRRTRNAAAQKAWQSDNPAEFRSWLASREQTGPRNRTQQGRAKPAGGRPWTPGGGPGGGPRGAPTGGPRFPSDHGAPPGGAPGRGNFTPRRGRNRRGPR